MVTLVGYIAQCHDHEYVIVSQFKDYQVSNIDRVKEAPYSERRVWIKDDKIYSDAVYCHTNGFPAIITGKSDDLNRDFESCPRYLTATNIEPIEDVEETFKEKLQYLANALNGADDRLFQMEEQVKEIVKGLLTAFTLFQEFDTSYTSASNNIRSAQYQREQLEQMLNCKEPTNDETKSRID